MQVSFYCRTVLLSDRSDLGGVIRPVVVMGKRRPGRVDLWKPVHEWGIPFSRRFGKKFIGKLCESSSASGDIHWAGPTSPWAFHDMEIDHRGRDICMAEQILDGADVDSAFQEMGGEGMSQGMAGGPFVEAGFPDSFFELTRHRVVMEVIAGDSTVSGVGAEGGGGEYPLPGPLPWGVRVFSGERFGKMGLTPTAREIMLVVFFSLGQMVLENVF